MVYDFHTHSFLSDGVLSPIELIRRAHVNGYRALAITDHVGLADLERVVTTLVKECHYASLQWDILALPGVELTHLPKGLIHEAAHTAKKLGARIVIVHGETIVEPVEPGTNQAALESPYVDILAHPGLITPEEAALAARQGIFLELSARRGHCLCNGLVAHRALAAGARLLLNSDAHEPHELLTPSLAEKIALGSGIDQVTTGKLLHENPLALLEKLKKPTRE